MKKRIIQTAVVLGAAAGLLILLFFAVKTKKLQINRWIVSDRDVIGADISEYQADVDMPVLMEQGIEFIYIKATEGSGHVGHKADAPDQAFPHSLFDSVIDAFGKSQVIGSEDQSFHICQSPSFLWAGLPAPWSQQPLF